MVNELEAIENQISEIFDDLKEIYITPVDQVKLSKTRVKIIELLEKVITYLNRTYSPMTRWQKENIVLTVNALYWDWLHLAINSLELAIADPETISPDNHYRNEIINLTYEDLIMQISKMKSF